MNPSRNFWIAFLGGWMVPGYGQWYSGKRNKGLFLFLIITATYLFGMWVAGFRHPRFQENPLYYFGRFGSGSMLLLSFVLSAPAYPRPDLVSWFDIGMLYSSVAGLLNLIVVLNIFNLYARPDVKATEDPTSVPAGTSAPAVTKGAEADRKDAAP